MTEKSPPILLRKVNNRNASLPVAGIDCHDATIPPGPFGVHFEDDPLDRTMVVRDEDIAGLEDSHSDTLKLEGWECGNGLDETLIIHPLEQQPLLQHRTVRDAGQIKLSSPAISQKNSPTPTTFTTKYAGTLIRFVKALWSGEANGRIEQSQKTPVKTR